MVTFIIFQDGCIIAQNPQERNVSVNSLQYIAYKSQLKPTRNQDNHYTCLGDVLLVLIKSMMPFQHIEILWKKVKGTPILGVLLGKRNAFFLVRFVILKEHSHHLACCINNKISQRTPYKHTSVQCNQTKHIELLGPIQAFYMKVVVSREMPSPVI